MADGQEGIFMRAIVIGLLAAIGFGGVVGCEDHDRDYHHRERVVVVEPGYYQEPGYYDSYGYWHTPAYYYYDGHAYQRREYIPRGVVVHERRVSHDYGRGERHEEHEHR